MYFLSDLHLLAMFCYILKGLRIQHDNKTYNHSVKLPTKRQCKLVDYEHNFKLTLTICAAVTLCIHF